MTPTDSGHIIIKPTDREGLHAQAALLKADCLVADVKATQPLETPSLDLHIREDGSIETSSSSIEHVEQCLRDAGHPVDGKDWYVEAGATRSNL